MAKILVLNGPNLNLLGTREPEVYGADTLAAINQTLDQMAQNNSVSLQAFQSNNEGEIMATAVAGSSPPYIAWTLSTIAMAISFQPSRKTTVDREVCMDS